MTGGFIPDENFWQLWRDLRGAWPLLGPGSLGVLTHRGLYTIAVTGPTVTLFAQVVDFHQQNGLWPVIAPGCPRTRREAEVASDPI